MYFFRHLFSPTNLELLKPLKSNQNVQLSKDITACIFLFSIFHTFGNIQLFLQNFAHSSLWGFFQISFCYNFSIHSAIETIQLLKCSAFYALSTLCFPTFYFFNFFRNSDSNFNFETNKKSFKSSSKRIDFQPHLVPHTLSERHHSNFKTVSRP